MDGCEEIKIVIQLGTYSLSDELSERCDQDDRADRLLYVCILALRYTQWTDLLLSILYSLFVLVQILDRVGIFMCPFYKAK